MLEEKTRLLKELKTERWNRPGGLRRRVPRKSLGKGRPLPAARPADAQSWGGGEAHLGEGWRGEWTQVQVVRLWRAVTGGSVVEGPLVQVSERRVCHHCT